MRGENSVILISLIKKIIHQMLRVLGWSFSNVKPGATHQQGGIHCKIPEPCF